MRRLYVVNSLKKLTVWLGSFVILIGRSLLFNADVSRDIALLVVVVGLSIQVLFIHVLQRIERKAVSKRSVDQIFSEWNQYKNTEKISIF